MVWRTVGHWALVRAILIGNAAWVTIVAEGFEPYEVQRFDFEPQSLTMSFEPWARASSH